MGERAIVDIYDQPSDRAASVRETGEDQAGLQLIEEPEVIVDLTPEEAVSLLERLPREALVRAYLEATTEVSELRGLINYLMDQLADKDRRLERVEREAIGLAEATVELYQLYEEDAARDNLTGLLARNIARFSLEAVVNDIKRAIRGDDRREGAPGIKHLTILMIDLDYFKKLNDAYGHPFGDKVIKLMAEILQQETRQRDIVSRWGGEEFLVGLEGADTVAAIDIAEKIRERISSEVLLAGGGQEVRVTCSIGVAALQGHMTLDRLINLADEALYSAKSKGRNQVAFHRRALAAQA